MRRVTIIGYGRFGKTLYRLLRGDFEVVIYVRSQKLKGESVMFTDSLEEAYRSEVVFYAVPISAFESVLEEQAEYITDKHVLVDVLSVKEYPKRVLEKFLLGKKTQALLTHPMFGPDSSKEGFEGLPIILDKFKVSTNEYSYWVSYFTRKGLKVIEMSAEEHDRQSAASLGVTHFVGRVLERYGFARTAIDALGVKKLHDVTEQTSHDTWQLFRDLQQYNSYTKEMRLQIGEAYDKVYNMLLPERVNKQYLTIGIQGGRGSFNEEAVQEYVRLGNIEAYKIRYLYTSEGVLASLHKGEIDRGQFAVHNSVGGIVGETIEAMARYKFVIEKEFAIKIAHALMIRRDARIEDITTIMTHPQVLAQCKSSLEGKYSYLVKTSGEGYLVDHARVAELLGEGRLPKHIAVMGSRVLASIYGLRVMAENLQDAKENWTSFLMVRR